MNDNDSIGNPGRRAFFRKSLPLIPATALAASGGALAAPVPAPLPEVPGPAVDPSLANAAKYQPRFFTTEEYRFLQAAAARLIPKDELGPGALEAGVPEFIDRQMGTAYAAGGLWYMQGPFAPDAPREMGYQLKLSPREVYRLGIAAADRWCARKLGKAFAELGPQEQDQALAAMEKGIDGFEHLPSSTFFSMLWTNTREGFFSDPMHGGNKGMAGWKLINFPGARADFMDWIERDEKYPQPPVSIRGARG
ncbi:MULTISPECIES: gluconate 2-dehydrogenase subunit 3 family protein [unclassified Achromobacter]|uniref:gluconate 2-dehydrogenase subunit 3 family protein n=1 Tax=unclassified Achromobacter TaxID=2626865 RepID=UPI00069F6491|nr:MULTISPECIES: gluconate 2-dehydrogenase subunit 3 family protein [unclassified Achromobacter]KOF55078.1 gluconate 2-dehydrogenase [Achromobacter sp. DMS1]